MCHQGLQELLMGGADMKLDRPREFNCIPGDTIVPQEPAEGEELKGALVQRQSFTVEPVGEGSIEMVINHPLDLTVIMKGET
jgi:hypothetical protein